MPSLLFPESLNLSQRGAGEAGVVLSYLSYPNCEQGEGETSQMITDYDQIPCSVGSGRPRCQ